VAYYSCTFYRNGRRAIEILLNPIENCRHLNWLMGLSGVVSDALVYQNGGLTIEILPTSDGNLSISHWCTSLHELVLTSNNLQSSNRILRRNNVLPTSGTTFGTASYRF
jgi:hypothetical protein